MKWTMALINNRKHLHNYTDMKGRMNDTFIEIIGGVALTILASLLYDVIGKSEEENDEVISNETEDIGYAIIVEEDELKHIR